MIRPLRSCLTIFAASALGLAVASAGDVNWAHAQDRQPKPLKIQDVDSFDYFIAPGFNGAPGAGQAFQAAASEPYDMLIADYYAGHNTIDPAGVRIFQDSNSHRGRLAIAYIDAGEFMRCCSNIDLPDQASWFDAQGELTATAPSWFGPPNPNFHNLWLVRDWDPAWQAYILSEIDKIIAAGFDGVFLDTLYNDGAWGPNGYAAGQAGVADYRESQKDFAKAIWYHVRDSHPNSRFVIITNYSGVLEDNVPALTEGLHYSDAFMKESEYFDPDNKVDPSVGNLTIDQYFATRFAKFYAGMINLHKVVLLQNYNLTFDNEALILKECARYGFLLSNTNFPQNAIHIDGLPFCTKEACWATNAAGQYVYFPRTDDAD